MQSYVKFLRKNTIIKTCIVTIISVTANASIAQDYGSYQFKVIGDWSNAPHYTNSEKPFWNKTLPDASGGALTAQLTPVDELGLTGFDVGRMLKLGLFDFVHAGFTYVAGDNPVFEGVDLAGAVQNWKQAREVVDAYRPILAKELEKTFDAKLLADYSEPTQVFYCRKPIRGISDLKGKKIRVYSRALSDLVKGMGGTPVSVDFAEVVTALQRGVVDCAVTGTLSGYTAKWYEVATNLYTLHAAQGSGLFLAVSNTTWHKLTPDAQKLVLDLAKQFEDKAWRFAEASDKNGINCNTGNGPCPFGEAQNMTLVTPSKEDLGKLQQIVEKDVLSSWAERCGSDCIAAWNNSVGKVLNLTAVAE